jgi:predicted O-linked N-acetylglucosamine transferase (SPINDLY family)
MNKHTLQQLFERATQAHQQSRLADARQLYAQVLQVHPYHADTLHLLGIVCSQLSSPEEAVEYIGQAIRINPEAPVYHHNLGEVYMRKGETEKALRSYLKALKLAPDFAEAAFTAANAYKVTGRLPEAITFYKEALRLNPAHTKALYNLGNTLLEQGDFYQAMECFKQVIRVQPDFAEAWNNMGICLQEWDRWQEAIQHYRKALSLKPAFEEACRNLAGALATEGYTEEARNYYRQLARMAPAETIYQLEADILCPVIFGSAADIANYRKELLQTLDSYAQHGLTIDWSRLHTLSVQPPAHLIYQGQDDLAIKKMFARLFSPSFTGTKATVNRQQKPHIGFVVTAGHEGVFLKCMRGVLEHMPPDVNIAVVCSAPDGEKLIRKALQNKAVHFLSIPKRFDLAVQLLREASFDLLYYWEVGTDVINYFLPFCRLASVQCTSWGWPVTSGIPEMDYFISCDTLETPVSESHYSEKLIRTKRLPVYYYHPPVYPAAKSLREYGLPEDRHLYLCTQNVRKVHPDFDNLIEQILLSDSSGIVVFIGDKHPQTGKLLQDRLTRQMPGLQDRIYFLPRMTESDYLALLPKASVILDTLYYGGGANTCYDAFAAGTPIVTLPTTFHRGRYAYAAYQQMGISECIARNEAEYVEIALRLATDTDYRTMVQQKIIEAKSMIFEDKQAVEELAALFLQLLSK